MLGACNSSLSKLQSQTQERPLTLYPVLWEKRIPGNLCLIEDRRLRGRLQDKSSLLSSFFSSLPPYTDRQHHGRSTPHQHTQFIKHASARELQHFPVSGRRHFPAHATRGPRQSQRESRNRSDGRGIVRAVVCSTRSVMNSMALKTTSWASSQKSGHSLSPKSPSLPNSLMTFIVEMRESERSG